MTGVISSGPETWAKRNPLITFFVLTFALSWTVWLTQPLLARLDPLSGQLYGLLATFGPGLAAILLSGLWNPRPAQPTPWPQRLWIPLFVLGISLWLTREDFTRLPSSTLPGVAAALWVVVNALPAWIFWRASSRVFGVRELLHSLTLWRVRPLFWLLALGMMGVSYLLGYSLLRLFGQPWPVFPRTEAFPGILGLLVSVFLSTFLYGGPLGEEIGWRGFALPRLQQRFDPLRSSLILGVVWGVWHFPLHFQGFYDSLAAFSPNLMFALLMRVGSTVVLAIVLTWLYNRTGGNLLLMVVLHTATNLSTGWLLPINAGVYIGTVLVAVSVVFLDRMWRRPDRLSSPA